MCSTQLKCSICNESTATNRIIVETCGHQKCRGCFIREEDGCSICIAANAAHTTEQSRPSSSQPEISAATIDHVKRARVIENVLISTTTDYSNKQRSSPKTENIRISKRPAHITVTRDDGNKVIAYTCTICKKSFKSRNNQQYHLYCDKSQPKPYECGRCDKQFITQSHLQYHEKTHDNNVSRCNVCDRVFAGEIGLRKHSRKHENEFRYECKLCDERFLYKEQLTAHENRHNNIFHNCTECSMQFLMKSNLTKHLLAHAGKNQEVCTICRKMYSGKSALKVHMLTHSNRRQFQCDSCTKTFIDQRTLDRHLRTHSRTHYYECSLCRAKSTRKDNIRRHVRNLHAETGVDVKIILDGIFQKYSEKNKQTDNKVSRPSRDHKTESIPKEPITLTAPTPIDQCRRTGEESVKNTPMSVIKFVGKASAPIDLVTEEETRIITLAPFNNVLPERGQCNADHESNTEPETSTDWNETPTYQPLTLEPIPQMEPLPLLTTHKNSNLSVYRQLLSPYFRRSKSKSEDAEINEAPSTSSVIINRPPKKMLDKYNIYVNQND